MTDSPTNPISDSEIRTRLDAVVRADFASTIADLSRLVRIPSVSWDAFDPAHVQRSAEAVAELARATGLFDSVDIRRAMIGESDEPGQPAVLGVRRARNGRPTVLLYAHHDVQPPGRDEDWDTPVFEPTLVGERLYGRGAADDKAGVMAHIGALRAVAAVLGEDFDLGVVLFIEGEEEFGSRSFANFLRDNREDLAADVIVVADSNNWDENTPGLTVSLRGNVTFRLTVRTLAHASHSGMFGGPVPDAMLAAVRTLNSLWDDAGSVAVPGLVRHDAPTPAYDEAQLRAETGLLPGVRPIGTGEILARIWNEPAISITGIDAPDVANASNTLIPETAVRVSVRLAPGEDPRRAAEAVEAHLRANAAFGAELTFDDMDYGSPFLVDVASPAVAQAEKAMADAWGIAPVRLGVGGSIPFIADLVREFPEAGILVTGVEDPHSKAHSPNESLHVDGFRRSLLSEALLMARLSTGNSPA